MRCAIAAALLLMVLAPLALAQDDDISLGGTPATPQADDDVSLQATIKPSFKDIALLPTRLTAYNQHDDAATASYTCCRARQEKEVKAAIAANQAFLLAFGDTAFAPYTLIHYGRVASFLPDAFRNQEYAFRMLLDTYPDSVLADDAAYQLAGLYARDGAHEDAVALYEQLVEKWPESTWADHALHALVDEYTWLERPADALNALNELADTYPKSEFCPDALYTLAGRFMEVQKYDSAINASLDLIDQFPYNDMADDAQWRIAQCYRLKGDLQGALDAYRKLIDNWYGSNLTNAAMLEANAINKMVTGATGDGAALYDPEAWNPAKDAQALWEEACHYQNYGAHARAVELFHEFIDKFSGNDLCDDAWYQIGTTYLRQEMLFENINNANGPDDVDKFREDYITSTGDEGAVPTDGSLSAQPDAQAAFQVIANDLKGSALQCDALGQIARTYIKYGDIESPVIPPDAAYTYQEMVINFPSSSVRCPWFTDSTWPVYAFCRLIDFYADEGNWDIAQTMYPELSAEYGAVFPEGMEKDKGMFYELMKLYQLKSGHAYFEMSKHIPYGFSPSDLLPEAYYYQSAMLMDQGDFARAAQLLERLVALSGNELAAPGTYLLAQCRIRLGDWEGARAAFEELAQNQRNSGLADDAQLAWAQYQEAAANPAKYDLSGPYAQVQAAYGVDPMHYDIFVGERCVVFAPFTRAAMMRMYNMPNVWDEGLRVLRDWAQIPDGERLSIVVDSGNESTFGTPFKVPGAQIKDPPDWSIGLAQISANVLAQGIPQLAERRDLLDGIGKFVAASLQYDLVTETRDAIGSAAAVKLPQEEVIRNRDAALRAVDDYVIAGEDATLSADVIAGMMYRLLDANGFTRDRLIDREPYRVFFSRLKEMPGTTEGNQAFATACRTAFGDGCAQQLKDWRLPLTDPARTAEARVSQAQ